MNVKILHWWLGARSKRVSKAAFATVLAVMMERHLQPSYVRNGGAKQTAGTYKDTSAALSCRAFATKSFDFTIRVYLVVLQATRQLETITRHITTNSHSHLNLFALVLDLLWGL